MILSIENLNNNHFEVKSLNGGPERIIFDDLDAVLRYIEASYKGNQLSKAQEPQREAAL